MQVMQRTHRTRDDRKWMPSSVRRTKTIAHSAFIGAYVLASLGVATLVPILLPLAKGITLAGVGSYWVGKKWESRRFDQKLRELADGEHDLCDVQSRANGELLVLHGTVEASHTIEGLLHGTKGVYRRMRFAKDKWIHEAATDFVLASEDGTRVPVQASGARWLTDLPEPLTYPREHLMRDHIPQAVRAIVVEGSKAIEATEAVLKVGDLIQIVGYKSVVADPQGSFVGYRGAPERGVIRSGPQLPLIISSIR